MTKRSTQKKERRPFACPGISLPRLGFGHPPTHPRLCDWRDPPVTALHLILYNTVGCTGVFGTVINVAVISAHGVCFNAVFTKLRIRRFIIYSSIGFIYYYSSICYWFTIHVISLPN
jgi:hypothetical protein